MSLSPSDALKLTKILGLLSSSSAGERANAGAAADAFIRERGLTWPDVIVTKLPPRSSKTTSAVPPWDAQEKLAFARRHFASLAVWEQSFVADDNWYNWAKPLTPKQEKCLDKIVVKLWEAGCR